MDSASMPEPNFSPSDVHRIRAAEGWLMLGDARSAKEELDGLPGDSAKHALVLRLRFSICSALQDWEGALQAAETLVTTAPDDKEGWINRSFALHELKRTEAAEAWLREARQKFPDEPIIPYNLACYASVLGRLEDARTCLEQALALGDSKEIKRMALQDPDLAALRSVNAAQVKALFS